MQGLGDTVKRLARLRRQAQPPGEPALVRRRVMKATTAFGPNPGNLRMLSYAPDGLGADAGVVVVLHGCSQSAESFAHDGGWLTLADRHGFMVVAAEQVVANNPNRCFNWFASGDIRRGEGEAASIAAMAAHAVTVHGLNPDRIFVVGLSAGGAMAAVMLATYPDVFAGGAVIAGLAYGVATGVPQALTAMSRGDGRRAPELGALVRAAAASTGRVPKIAIWHGDADATVNRKNADDLVRQWAWTHGLDLEPSETEMSPRRRRSVWRSATGEAAIEYNLIEGLGHGVPLATQGVDGLGSASPFMLEAGVSSSAEILRFWGLADSASLPVGATPRPVEKPLGAHSAPAVPRSPAVGAQVMATLAPHTSPDVQSVIEKALRTAGLLP